MSQAALGAVLAGGASRRFGRPKALATLSGRPLGRWSADALEEVTPRVVVIANDPAVGAGLGLPWRADLRPGLGPLGGVLTAVHQAREEGRPGALVLACDLPFVPPSLLQCLIGWNDDSQGGAGPVVPEAPGPTGLQPLCAWYPVGCLAGLEEACAGGERALWRVVRSLGTRTLPLSETARRVDPHLAFLNLNRPEDLERAEAIAGSGATAVGAGGSSATTDSGDSRGERTRP